MASEHQATVLDTVQAIEPIDITWSDKAAAHHQRLTKPPGSLGELESVGVQLCAIQQKVPPIIDKTGVLVFAADHGITKQHCVGPYPREVTAQMVSNFVHGGAAINVLAKLNNADFCVVDMGVDADLSELGVTSSDQFIAASVARGTQDVSEGPAMTQDQLYEAMATGIHLADECSKAAHQAVAIGEMGIGNTTIASAVTAALLKLQPSEVTGRGTGADDVTLSRKIDLIETALSVNSNDAHSGWTVLQCLGGFELAGIAGLAIGLAKHRIAIVADGYISTAAVFAATKISPYLNDYVLSGHRSSEPGHQALLAAMQKKPLLDLGLRLGEGTGACLSLSLIKAAASVMQNMATFDEAGVQDKPS